MNKKILSTLLLCTMVLVGCKNQANTTDNDGENETKISSTEQTSFDISSSTTESSEIEFSTTSSSSSSNLVEQSSEAIQNTSSDSVEKAYEAILAQFKEKLFGEWSCSNSLAHGLDLYKEITDLTLNEDLTYSFKVTSTQNDTTGIVKEDSGTFKISENGLKQTVAGLPQLVDNYDDFTKQSSTLEVNLIQIRFTETTLGAYILPTGELKFDNPSLLFTENFTGGELFEKF